jgi:hypothetical protein
VHFSLFAEYSEKGSLQGKELGASKEKERDDNVKRVTGCRASAIIKVVEGQELEIKPSISTGSISLLYGPAST